MELSYFFKKSTHEHLAFKIFLNSRAYKNLMFILVLIVVDKALASHTNSLG